MPIKSNKSPSDDQDDPNIVTGQFGNEDGAADLIRDKVARIYKEEPSAKQEIAEADAATVLSKHQKFMHELGTSGKDLATIQTEWHNYYVGLSAEDKYDVWQEFYDSQAGLTKPAKAEVAEIAQETTEKLSKNKNDTIKTSRPKKLQKDDLKPKELQAAIRKKVTANGQLQVKHHIQSLMFGLSMGFLVIFIFLFSFFNEVFIAPFIQPSRASADTPIIISSNGVAPTSSPEVIIPKINVEIPVDYNETSTNESVIENDLEDGVVHYPTTVLPGQDGNAAFFGHSSNNIFNQGKYKFAFVLLHTLVSGDTFYLTYNDKVFVYKVISKTIVSPSDVNVLNSVAGQTATATLITCDPPGTSINRLIVVGQQISPNPSTDTTPAPRPAASNTPTVLPGNGPTLWSKFIGTIIGKLITLAVVATAVIVGASKLDKHVKALKIARGK